MGGSGRTGPAAQGTGRTVRSHQFPDPFAGTPLENQAVLSRAEALKIVALYRFLLPDRALRICGGRFTVFGETHKHTLLTSGASGLMIGDYLTSKGANVASDLEEINQAGLTSAAG